MKILLISDHEDKWLWDKWSSYGADKLKGVDLILSAGDLSPYYLEFLVTMTNVPLLYIRGNHDSQYDTHAPEGCLDIDEQIYEYNGIRIAGLGGSKRYKEGKDMYTEREMRKKISRLRRALRRTEMKNRLRGGDSSKRDPGSRVDIILTHAPCKGYGDMDDLPHSGFMCFNDLLDEWKPKALCYGHIHQEYGNFKRVIDHPSGAKLINGNEKYFIELPDL